MTGCKTEQRRLLSPDLGRTRNNMFLCIRTRKAKPTAHFIYNICRFHNRMSQYTRAVVLAAKYLVFPQKWDQFSVRESESEREGEVSLVYSKNKDFKKCYFIRKTLETYHVQQMGVENAA